ncbi:MAG: sensor histidine kinase, partial [Bdellovibrionota bacterium]
ALFHTIDGRGLPLKGRRNAELASFRMLTSLAPGRDAPNFVIQVAAPDAFVELAAQRLRRFLGIGVPLSLLVAMFAGLYFSRRALRPVNDIIEKANRLSVDNLSERIPLPLVNDELRRLSVTLNALLDRLQRAFESQERFIADASHELKTPLAILRGELDVFRGRARSEQEISAFTVSAAQELDHLSRLVEDLLVLARVDAGSGVISKSETRLDELALETISRLQALARARDVKIKLDLDEKTESFAVQGDADLLRILFKNLIENAVKYSPSGESVGVRVGADGEFAVIRVKDHGPGIAREDQPKIFERFFRVKGDPTAERISGAGLGLAIARTIAEIHGGTLSVQSEVGIGSEFTAKVRRAAGP